MTRRSSVRANAREIYRDLAAKKAAEEAPTPDPSPRVADARGGGEQSLTARVRALYEDSAVPVREIAAIAGVTERTIYKYVAKQGWKRRYRCAPEKGAGGRFIRREDKGLPFAQGLKATDPAGAQRAVVAYGEAERLSCEAQAEAQEQQRAEAQIQAMEWTCRALSQLRVYLDARDQQQHPGAPENDPLERVYRLEVTLALSRWEALLAVNSPEA